MRGSRSLPARTLLVALSGVLFLRCSTTDPSGGSPLDPASPPTSGTLELTVHEVGALPDADGFEVTLTLASQDVPAVRVFSIGPGSLRFPELPSGVHSLRVEGLADPCSVTGTHPRLFAIFPGETTRLDLYISCPGPGALLVKTVSRGLELGAGYAISVAGRSTSVFPIGPNDSLLIGEAELPEGTDWRVSLTGAPGNCWVDPPPLYVAPLKGATVRREFYIACIPRGDRIAFQFSGGIYVTEGGEARNVGGGGLNLPGPSLSPDKSRVLFVEASEAFQLFFGIAAADGTGLTTTWISPGGRLATIGSQAWSPDGSRIVFSQEAGGSTDLYVLNLDGGGETRLTFGGWNGYPAWSPDGRSIAFCRLEGGIFDGYYDLYRVELDGSGERRLAEFGCDPAWSPDGSRIAYFSWFGPTWGLIVIDADGSHPIPFSSFWGTEPSGRQPSWSPDGTWIAYNGGPLDRIWLVEFDGHVFGTPIPYRFGSAPSWR